MSSGPKTKIWRAEPHTVAKIEIVRRYAHRWGMILGQRFRGAPLTYIDGFAGPGEYMNHAEGSPLAAFQALKDATVKANPWVAGDVRLLFIEKDEKRCSHLGALCSQLESPPGIRVENQCTDFVSGIDAAKARFGKAFLTSAPLLVFVDPFGATGAPFRTIREILSSRTSEVIINFDADGIARIWSAGKAADADRHLTEIFGSDVWKELEWSKMDHRARCLACARLYKRCLLAIPNVDYAFTFEMGEASNRLDYFLIFASQHERGLEKMKEVMKEIDQTGDFKFYDTLVGQEQLFRFDQPELWIEPMIREFAGRSVPFSEIKKWVLNETPFFTFKTAILRPACAKGLLAALPKAGVTLSKGQFPEEKLTGIQFFGDLNA
jgi:three-Cys-motif partner protein